MPITTVNSVNAKIVIVITQTLLEAICQTSVNAHDAVLSTTVVSAFIIYKL